MARNDVRREYAAWLALDRRTKIALSLPLTQKDFAEDKGVDSRTLRRWQQDPAFTRLVAQKKVALAKAAPGAAVSAVGPPRAAIDARTAVDEFPAATPEDDPMWEEALSPAERQYLKVKDTLGKMAADGNQGAIDLFLKHYGKPFIEAEQQGQDDFSALSDRQLADEFVRILGLELVADALAAAMPMDGRKQPE